ncbi:Serine/threonine protein kinase PrkC, regulator of stationary phase [Serinicoccus hydrothermalis]|uniref:non-specific serine/threonine protein kinase n=1 Tax=Serinicoccus hydrothermalis TaxID=1758689 RepID=A0A1B1NCZ2_9MICO|nr:Stk1 family PASTA domain-containing Ser/Thr kinase [Serinicoccus hydrothermalis]ANS79235.1 Serine/threonine protein kinase PrkC, regulator of stationary phase [Serinicoccus hydrothermalis]
MTDDPTQATPPPERQPRVLGGRYELGELIGRGGMADVHVGHDLRLGRPVAIKVLRTDLARDSSFLSRFRREAQSAAGLSHPSIVGVFDSGEESVTESGGATVQVPYIVMELVEGRTLRELLNEHGTLEPDEAARITGLVLSALEYAHERGLVHRDIKPANVMVTAAGAVKVMDFGIARAIADTAATMTQTQAVMGTARYLSPEQAQGLDVDGRSDLYSVGCLLYELLVGRTPFQGDPVSLVYQHLGEAPKAPSTHGSGLPAALDAIALHALEKKPEDRYQDAGAFRADLNAARADEPVSAEAQSTYDRVLGLGAAAGAGAAVASARPSAAATQAVPVGGGREPQAYPGEPTGIFAAAGADDSFERTDEMPVRERRHPGAALLLGALATVALAGVAWVLFQVMGPNGDDGPEMLVVPSTVGSTEAQARTTLTAAGFTVADDVRQRNSDEDPGVVVEQDPPGGELERGGEVTLTVSAGPEAQTIPRLQGLEEQAARDLLEREGFTNVRGESEQSDDPDWEEGQVVSSDPEEGEEIDPGDEIVLTISSGDVEVPDVVGRDQNEAVLLLDAQTLEWEIETRRTADADPGTVLEQSEEPGDTVAQGSTVDLVVAAEPVQTETATEVITETITPTPTSEPTQEPTETDEPTESDEPTETEEPTESEDPTIGPVPTDPEPTDPGPPEDPPADGDEGD